MLPASNSSAGGAEEERQCIVNDQMGPFPVLYTIIFIISLPGNLLSVWTFIRSPRAKQQSSSVFLLNLLVADMLLLLALPFKILKDIGAAPWSLMVFHCQVSAVTIYISLYASIAFLAFIITDRYLQEQRYLSCSSLKKDLSLHWHALTVILCTALFLNASAVVLLSSGLTLRRLLNSRKHPELWGDVRRAAASVTAMALAYILSFVPYHMVRTPYTLSQTKVITDCHTKRQLFLGKEATLLLSVLHLCFDPLLFFYLYSPFRQTLRNMFPCSRKQSVSEAEQEEMMEPAAPAQMPSNSTYCL
ncbi:probable G-protein coupled receptor 171 isoform X3 [Cottoperca gobio]|uniref:Probable G-protein coupled receptor 171 isoform X3 n=1 Tax=Cottoperca gobio TaxID=56716 RepID=A0A6J2PEF3_COTGO|nr:probable G-protein coupled receptor 171 isoform X3 [Cottoperca gobio]